MFKQITTEKTTSLRSLVCVSVIRIQGFNRFLMPTLSCKECKVYGKSCFRSMPTEWSAQPGGEQRKVMSFEPGFCITEEGTEADGVFCIMEGTAKRVKKDRKDRQCFINLVYPGELIGLRAVLQGGKFAHSSFAYEEMTACFIPLGDFKEQICQAPQLAISLMQELAKELQLLERKLRGYEEGDTDGLVLDALGMLGGAYGYESNKRCISRPLYGHDLSELTGLSNSKIQISLRTLLEDKKIQISEENYITLL